MTFQEARAKLTEISGGKFRAMYYSLVESDGFNPYAECRVYIACANNPVGVFSTWEQAIDAHIKAQLPVESKSADVAEMPEGV
jgi:hypothetical protein